MTKSTITIRLATLDDSDSLTDFRISQFKSAKEFELLNPSLLSKQSGQIFIAELDNKIVSTMQVEKCNDLTELNAKTTNFIPTQFEDYPCYNLTKGATIKELRNTGLNSYLRLLTLRNAAKTNINSLVGTSYENSPRLHLLNELGYEFYEVNEKLSDYIKPNGKVFFFSLSKDKFGFAIDRLTSETEPLIKEYIINNKTTFI